MENVLNLMPYIVAVLLLLFAVIAVQKLYKKCPPNELMIIYGKTASNGAAKLIHGGGSLVIPLIQDFAYISLAPMTFDVEMSGALSQNNIRVNVPTNFTVAVSSTPAIANNAAKRLLGLERGEVIGRASEIATGQLRQVVATMTIEAINRDRETFQSLINQNVGEELNKIGLEVINVNISDVTDESGYIEAIGQKAAAEAIQAARVDVAEQEKSGAIGVAEADREKVVNVSNAEATAEMGKKQAEQKQRVFVAERDADIREGENLSAAKVAKVNADLAVQKAEAARRGEIARAEANRAILETERETELARLTKEEVVQEEITKRKIEIAAEADAERQRRIAQGEADAIRAKYGAEATGLQQILEGKAAGYKKIIAACNNDPAAAASMLMIEKLESVIHEQVSAIRDLKIDKITVWDSQGGQADGGGSGLKNFLRDYGAMVPPIHEIAAQAGLKLPGFLGEVATDPTHAKVPGPEAESSTSADEG